MKPLSIGDKVDIVFDGIAARFNQNTNKGNIDLNKIKTQEQFVYIGIADTTKISLCGPNGKTNVFVYGRYCWVKLPSRKERYLVRLQNVRKAKDKNISCRLKKKENETFLF
jgi:hypothetical protein